MPVQTNTDLIDRWKDAPAPLLPLLHAFHDRDGHLADEVLRAVSKGLKTPLADLFGTVTFYHHFARKAPGQTAPRVCTGPVCRHRGADALLQSLAPFGATAMPCAGRCDQPIPVIEGHTTKIGRTQNDLTPTPSPMPPPNPGGLEECVFAHIRTPNRARLAGYQQSGGYQALHKARQLQPLELIQIITDAKLAGRGGAGFPTGVKWKAVLDAPGDPKTIVCNADEGEPGCFKDRAVLDHDPHALIEGMLLAAHATGARRAFIYLRYEYPETFGILQQALDEARAADLMAPCDIHLIRGAGAYICGEEGSLLNSLEGKHPFPRNRPPFPVTHGFENKPTAVNNVETLASVPPIVAHGAEWYRNLGYNGQAGTKIISLSGDIARPGNYEVPLGFSLQTLLYDWAGGPPQGHSIQAVSMAGLSGGFLGATDLDVTLDEPSIRAKGSFLGAGGIIVYDDSRDMVQEAHSAMEFFADESCGKCFPCRIGTRRLSERLAGGGPQKMDAWFAEVDDMGQAMKATSACGLGMAAPNITDSLIKYFPDQVARHVGG